MIIKKALQFLTAGVRHAAFATKKGMFASPQFGKAIKAAQEIHKTAKDKVIKSKELITAYVNAKTPEVKAAVASAINQAKNVKLNVMKPKEMVTAFNGDIKTKLSENIKGFYEKYPVFRNKIVKRTAIGIPASYLTWRLANSATSSIVKSIEPKIPEYYRDGYDTINEELTDFGSPIKLAKAANKVLTRYYSSTRSGVRTSVNSILARNPALRNSKRAINHQRF